MSSLFTRRKGNHGERGNLSLPAGLRCLLVFHFTVMFRRRLVFNTRELGINYLHVTITTYSLLKMNVGITH